MKWLGLLFLLLCTPAVAQNTTCATRPTGDNSNACASTAFVHGGFQPTLPTYTANNPLIGNGTNVPVQGTRQGTSTVFPVIDGTSTNGQCAVFDAAGGFTSIPCTSAGSGTVGSGLLGQIAGYNATGTAVVGVPPTCVPIELFGGGTGQTGATNLTAFNAEVAAFGTDGGCIGFSAGIYQFAGGTIGNGALAITYPTTVPYVVSIKGAGQDLTILNWAAAPTGAGLALATNKGGHAFHLSDLSFRVGVAASSSTAFSVTNSAALGAILNSTINNVSFLGADGGGVTDYWGFGVKIVTQSAVNFTDDNFWGPSSGTSGTGIYVSSTSSPGFGVIYNVTGSNFYSLATGFEYGDWIQGVTINACNFTTGSNGIVVVPSASAILAELSVVNSQFGVAAGDAIVLLSPVFGSNIANNYFLTNTAKVGISASSWGGGTIVGNTFGVSGSVTGGQNAILFSASASNSPTTITGNIFLNNTTAVDLSSSTNSITVGLNSYIGNTNKVVNGGATACPASASGNCIGTATSGAGFVP